MNVTCVLANTQGGVLTVRPLIDTPDGPAVHERVPWTDMGSVRKRSGVWHWVCGDETGEAKTEADAVTAALKTLGLTQAHIEDTIPDLLAGWEGTA